MLQNNDLTTIVNNKVILWFLDIANMPLIETENQKLVIANNFSKLLPWYSAVLLLCVIKWSWKRLIVIGDVSNDNIVCQVTCVYIDMYANMCEYAYI